MPRYRLVLSDATALGAWDLRTSLQKRLRLFAVVITAALSAWFALGFLRWHQQWATDPLISVTQPPGYGKVLPLIGIEGLCALLLTRRRFGVRRLRLFEWLVLGPVALFLADKDCMNIGRVTLDELSWNVGTFSNDSAMGWIVLMVGYGVLIPNTWRRCAAGVSLMALMAFIPTSVALVAKGMPAIPATQYLGIKMITLSLASVIVVYGSHRVQLLEERLRSTVLGAWTLTGSLGESRGAEAEPLPKTAGRYEVVGELTRGGMGTIYKGYDTELGRQVAIKVLLEKHLNNVELLQRFLGEAQIAAQLQHPGIVPIYEVGQLPDARPYFAMQLVQGQTLDRLLADRKDPSQDLPHFLKAFELVCQTIAYAHTQRVIHRDIKPENVMIGPFGEVMVMDWGIAKVLAQNGANDATSARQTAEKEMLPTVNISVEADLEKRALKETLPGAILGTVAYMAPEQASGNPAHVDERADVFSLGAILCVILTGQPPYTGSKSREVYRQAQRADLAAAYQRLDGCSADRQLVAMAKDCLAPKSVDRPRNAGEVLREVTAYLEAVFKQPERDLVRFFELSLDLFCIAGLDGYFRRVNSNFSRVLGYSDKELLSQPFIEFIHPDDREKTTAEVTKLQHGLPVVHFQNRYKDVHGKYRCFDWTAKPIPAEGVIFAVARDVTERV